MKEYKSSRASRRKFQLLISHRLLPQLDTTDTFANMGFLSKHFVPAALLAVPAMVFGMTSTEEFSRGEGFDDFDALELRQFNVPNGPTWHPKYAIYVPLAHHIEGGNLPSFSVSTWKLNKPGKEEKKTKAADRGAKRPRDIVADSLEERQFTKPDGTIWYGK